MKSTTLALLLVSGLSGSAMANGIIGGNQNGLGPGGYIPGQPPGTPIPPPAISYPAGAGPVTTFPPAAAPGNQSGAVPSSQPAAAPSVRANGMPARK